MLYKLRVAEVADGLWQMSGPAQILNVYWCDGVLFDAATRFHLRPLLRSLAGRPVRVVALTHCHPDHQGVAAAVCRRFAAELAVHELDAAAMEGGAPMSPLNAIGWLGRRTIAGPTHPVSRRLRDGDRVGEFRVIHTPGHTPGHVIYFRDRDRTAVVGDVVAHQPGLSGRLHLVEPAWFFSSDRMENRRSLWLLAGLRPAVVCFGHGPPIRDPERLARFAEERRWPGGPAALS